MVGKGRCGDESATTTGRERKEVGKGKRERERKKRSGEKEATRGARRPWEGGCEWRACACTVYVYGCVIVFSV